MCPGIPDLAGSYIVVADEDRTIANFVIDTLEKDGHTVFWAYDGISALQFALSLKVCDLLISNSRVGGRTGVDLIVDLRERLPWLSILYLANEERSSRWKWSSVCPWTFPFCGSHSLRTRSGTPSRPYCGRPETGGSGDAVPPWRSIRARSMARSRPARSGASPPSRNNPMRNASSNATASLS